MELGVTVGNLTHPFPLTRQSEASRAREVSALVFRPSITLPVSLVMDFPRESTDMEIQRSLAQNYIYQVPRVEDSRMVLVHHWVDQQRRF